MKSSIAALVTALALAAAVAAGGAGADGKGSISILLGGQGALAPDGKVRYVALTTGRQTIVSVVRVRGGQILGWRLVRGYFGVPVVSLDGRTEGVSRDGRTLVLASTPSVSRTGATGTRFAVIDTRTLRLRWIALRGSFAYDALSPDASTLYLVEYLSTAQNAPYRVRAYDVASRRLLARAIVDRIEREAVMRGQPVTRATSPDGRWAYTLYARQKAEPFVHALDTVRREAFCIDLPFRLPQPKQMELRLKLADGGGMLSVLQGRTSLAEIDTRALSVQGG